jgi:anthranilate phosphoribosyltransferase
VLARLGSESAWVVHGSDGLDELTTTGVSHVAQLKNGEISRFDLDPADAGLKPSNPADLKGGDAATNAEALNAVLAGSLGAYRDIVLLNSAAALLVAGKAENIKGGADLARTAIDGGGARAVLDRLIAMTNSGVPA